MARLVESALKIKALAELLLFGALKSRRDRAGLAPAEIGSWWRARPCWPRCELDRKIGTSRVGVRAILRAPMTTARWCSPRSVSPRSRVRRSPRATPRRQRPPPRGYVQADGSRRRPSRAGGLRLGDAAPQRTDGTTWDDDGPPTSTCGVPQRRRGLQPVGPGAMAQAEWAGARRRSTSRRRRRCGSRLWDDDGAFATPRGALSFVACRWAR
ncbi:MAG: hypothetical protein R3A48_20180 [Polyangiales bacterium]